MSLCRIIQQVTILTCRNNTDNILRVASCISLSRAAARESICMSRKMQTTHREIKLENQ